MPAKMSKEKRDMIFHARENFIDNICKWEIKVFYGLSLAFVGIIIAILNYSVNFQAMTGLHPLLAIIIIVPVGAILIGMTEIQSMRRYHRLYRELINDVENDKVNNFKKFSLREYFLS